MEKNIRGYNVVSGAHGSLWIDNVKVMEFKEVSATVTAERKDVQLGLSVDSKIVALKGEGSVKLEKVYSRASKILKSWIKGKDMRSKIVTNLADPDSPNKQEERVSIDNVWFNKLDLIKITKGEVVEEELTFGFTPSDAGYENEIK